MMTGPRVLHLIDQLALGGAQTMLGVYADACAGANAPLSIYALRQSPNPVEISNAEIWIDASPLRFSLAPIMRLRRLIRDRKFDVLHCHLFRSQCVGWLLKKVYFPRINLIFHEHGRVVRREDGESQAEAAAFRSFLRLATPNVNCFLCISDFVRDRIVAVAPRAANRCVVIENPISLRRSQDGQLSTLRQTAGVPSDHFVVGFAGRLVRRKGWRDFLDAVRLLIDKIPAFFLIAGDGPERAAVNEYIQTCGLQRYGRMLGHISGMDEFYRALDCFVMPSLWEPHGLSHIEAQNLGVPVVVSNVPGLSSTVHDGVDALFFQAGDSGALARRLFELATDEELRSRLSTAGKFNAERFDVIAFVEKLNKVYRAQYLA